MTALALRWRYALLAVAAAGLLVARRHSTGDWDWFVLGSSLLRGPHPLSLYATHPGIQVGPLALVSAVPFTLVSWGLPVVKAVIFAGGLTTVRSAELVGRSLRGSVPPARVLLGGLVLLPLWSFLASAGHLDDAMAVTGVALAMVYVARGRSLPAGLLLGLAAAAKPWAVLAIPVLLGLPKGSRARAGLTAVLVPGAVWLPFALAAGRTLSALSAFHIPLSPYSGLHLFLRLPLGVDYGGWVRPLQFGVALGLSVVIARRGVWWAVPAVAFGVRLVLDPGSISYYGAGVGAGTLFVDLAGTGLLPILTVGAAIGIALPTYLELYLLAANQLTQALRLASQTAYLRLGTAAAIVVLAALTTTGDLRSWPIRPPASDAPLSRPAQGYP
jgi:hypothetical protein